MKKLFMMSCLLLLQQISGMDTVGAGMERLSYKTISLEQWAILYYVANCNNNIEKMQAIMDPLSKHARKRVRAKVAEQHQKFLEVYIPKPEGDVYKPAVTKLKKFFKKHDISFQYNPMMSIAEWQAEEQQRASRERYWHAVERGEIHLE